MTQQPSLPFFKGRELSDFQADHPFPNLFYSGNLFRFIPLAGHQASEGCSLSYFLEILAPQGRLSYPVILLALEGPGSDVLREQRAYENCL
jgi:hypothetical protein